MTKTQATAEQKFDAAIDSARAESSDALLGLMDAADCADQAAIDGDGDWYAFAVGVAAHDPRSRHLFA